jgi:hypothetical protein
MNPPDGFHEQLPQITPAYHPTRTPGDQPQHPVLIETFHDYQAPCPRVGCEQHDQGFITVATDNLFVDYHDIRA